MDTRSNVYKPSVSEANDNISPPEMSAFEVEATRQPKNVNYSNNNNSNARKMDWRVVATGLLFFTYTMLQCVNLAMTTIKCTQANLTITKEFQSSPLMDVINQLGPRMLPLAVDGIESITEEGSHTLCTEFRQFPIPHSGKRITICTYQDQVRVDIRDFVADRATIKGIYLTMTEFISFANSMNYIHDEVLRQANVLSRRIDQPQHQKTIKIRYKTNISLKSYTKRIYH